MPSLLFNYVNCRNFVSVYFWNRTFKNVTGKQDIFESSNIEFIRIGILSMIWNSFPIENSQNSCQLCNSYININLTKQLNILNRDFFNIFKWNATRICLFYAKKLHITRALIDTYSLLSVYNLFSLYYFITPKRYNSVSSLESISIFCLQHSV